MKRLVCWAVNKKPPDGKVSALFIFIVTELGAIFQRGSGALRYRLATPMFLKIGAIFGTAPQIEGFIVSEASGGYYLDDLKVGDTASFGKTVTEADIVLFAGITGDTNPVHLNQEFAEATLFKGRIAHGMLSAGFISTVLGTKLPGPGAIYLSQSLKFKAPVRPGDTVKATVTVTDIVLDRKRVTLSTVCTVGDVVVIEGEAVVMVQPRPVAEPS